MMNRNNLTEQYFLSGKSKNEIFYRNNWELELVKKLDQDSKILKIEQFLLPIVENKTNIFKEEAFGFILNKAGKKTTYLIISDYLSANPDLANKIKRVITDDKRCKFKFISQLNALEHLRY